MASISGVAVVLRALADARDDQASPFVTLVGDLPSEARAELTLQLRRHYDGQTAYAVVALGAQRADGSEVLWSVAVTASPVITSYASEVCRQRQWINVQAA